MNRAIAQLVAVLFVSIAAFGECRAPKYEVGRKWLVSRAEVIMAVSIAPERFNREDLYCLAQRLRGDLPNAKKITVKIFNSKFAAHHISDVAYTVEAGTPELALRDSEHAAYIYDDDEREDYVLLRPQARGSRQFQMRIDIGRPLPACTISMWDNGRCLVEFNNLEYPLSAWLSMVRGSVVLAAKILPNGAVADATVTQVNASPESGETMLSQAALENLSSWYFERASATQLITIRFDFEVAGPPDSFLATHLSVVHPDILRISVNPPLESQRESLP